MELMEITDRVYYIKNRTNIGIIKSGTDAIVIDTGLDDAAAKKILRILKEKEINPVAIINTHSHADHCGGNSYLQENTGARIYASEVEAGIIQYPYLEPLYLFSGAAPIKDLKNKFLMANPSRVDYVISTDEKKLTINDTDLEIVSLPGHSPRQIGIGFEGVLFCGDAIFAREVLEKYKLPFNVDINRQKETLTRLKDLSYQVFVPSHFEPTEDVTAAVDYYLEVIEGIEQYILRYLQTKKTTEEVLEGLFTHYGIKKPGVQQYYLLQTVVLAFLSSLYEQKKLE